MQLEYQAQEMKTLIQNTSENCLLRSKRIAVCVVENKMWTI